MGEEPARRGAARGRPTAGQVAERRQAALEAMRALLQEHGARGATMSAVAARAGVSKESLYTWFGEKQGLLAALIEANALEMNARVQVAIDRPASPREVLVAFATDLLVLLTGSASLSINRAAMAALPGDPTLAELLRQHGRETTGPLLSAYLERCHREGLVWAPEPARAFTQLYGLVVEDRQIAALLGAPPAPRPELEQHAADAVDAFLALSERQRAAAESAP